MVRWCVIGATSTAPLAVIDATGLPAVAMDGCAAYAGGYSAGTTSTFCCTIALGAITLATLRWTSPASALSSATDVTWHLLPAAIGATAPAATATVDDAGIAPTDSAGTICLGFGTSAGGCRLQQQMASTTSLGTIFLGCSTTRIQLFLLVFTWTLAEARGIQFFRGRGPLRAV